MVFIHHSQLRAVWNVYGTKKHVDFAFLFTSSYLKKKKKKKAMVPESYVFPLLPRNNRGKCRGSAEITSV